MRTEEEIAETHAITQKMISDGHKFEREYHWELQHKHKFYNAVLVPQRVAPTFKVCREYTDGGSDIMLEHRRTGGWFPLNPKQAWALNFSEPQHVLDRTNNFRGLLLETVAKWNARQNHPWAYPIQSVFSKVVLVVPIWTSLQHWKKMMSPGTRGYPAISYVCPAQCLITEDHFIEMLKQAGY